MAAPAVAAAVVRKSRRVVVIHIALRTRIGKLEAPDDCDILGYPLRDVNANAGDAQKIALP